MFVLELFAYSLFSIAVTLFLVKKIFMGDREKKENEKEILEYIEKLKQEITDFLDREKLVIKDAIINFDIRVRQAKSTTEKIEELINFNQNSIRKIEQQNEIVNKISEKIQTISQQAENLNKEIIVLDKGFDKLEAIHGMIKSLESKVHSIHSVLEAKEMEANQKLQQVLDKILQESKNKVREFIDKENMALKGLFQQSEAQFQQIEEQKYQLELLKEKLENFQQTLDEKFSLEATKLEEKFKDLLKLYQDRFKSIEGGLQQIKDTALQSLKEEITKIRTEIEEFSLQTLSKRDEILLETRRMANALLEQMESFQEKYLLSENKLMELTNKSKQEIYTKYEEFLKQWEYNVKSNMEELKIQFGSLKEEIENLRNQKIQDLDTVFQNYYDKYEIKFRNISMEEERRLQNIKKEYEVILDRFIDLGEQLKRNLLFTLENLKSELSDFASSEKYELLQTREGFLKLREEIEGKIDMMEEQLREATRIRHKVEEVAEKSVKEIRNVEEEVIQSLEKRASRFLEEQDEKLGKLNQTIDEKIARQLTILIDKGQLQIEELEKRTSETIKKSMENMHRDLVQMRNEIANIRAEMIAETEKVRVLKDEVFRELSKDTQRLRKFEERLSLIDKAMEFISKFDQGLEVLTKKLEEIQDHKRELEEFLNKILQIESMKQSIEQELKTLSEKKVILDAVENRFLALSDKLQEIDVKLVNIETADKISERIEQRLLKLDEYRKVFEDFFKDITERKKYIENSIRIIEKAKRETIEAGENAKQLLQKMDIFEIRREALQKELEELEKKVAMLKDIDIKFKSIEARFEQIDVLMSDLELKQSQISVMLTRLTEISDRGGFIRQELESLVSEASEKMDKLSAFYETVEKMLAEADKFIKEKEWNETEKVQKPILDEWKKEGIITLYTKHKWEPELIAERLNLDVSLVRAVISAVQRQKENI